MLAIVSCEALYLHPTSSLRKHFQYSLARCAFDVQIWLRRHDPTEASTHQSMYSDMEDEDSVPHLPSSGAEITLYDAGGQCAVMQLFAKRPSHKNTYRTIIDIRHHHMTHVHHHMHSSRR